MHGHFARGVEGAGKYAARPRAAARQIEAGERALLHGGKLQRERLGNIEPGAAHSGAAGCGERELNGQLHSGVRELGKYCAVTQFNHGVHYALRVNEGGYFIVIRPEQVVRLDNFKALVEHGGAVHRYLCAHIPRGVGERHCGSNALELLGRKIFEWPAACRYNKPFEGRTQIEPQALPYCRMLAVYRADIRARAGCEGHYDIAAADERLLICEGERFARAKRRERISEPRKAARRDEHDVGLSELGRAQRALLSRAEARAFWYFGLFGRLLVGKRGVIRPHLRELPRKELV